MPKKWDPIAGTLIDEASDPNERPAKSSDSFPFPSLGTSPVFPNLDPSDGSDEPKPDSTPQIGSLPPMPNVSS
jgi:hypothetical protein